MSNLKHINFDYFKEFDGMTVEFEAAKSIDDNYRITAIVRLNGRLFLEYDCISHYSYFDELIYKVGGVRVDVCETTLKKWVSSIANSAEWELSYPNK